MAGGVAGTAPHIPPVGLNAQFLPLSLTLFIPPFSLLSSLVPSLLRY